MPKFFTDNIPYYLNQNIGTRKNKFTDSLFPLNMNSILGKDKYGNYTNIKNGKKKMNKLLFDLDTKENKIQDIIC